jgi:hypothetical protein
VRRRLAASILSFAVPKSRLPEVMQHLEAHMNFVAHTARSVAHIGLGAMQAILLAIHAVLKLLCRLIGVRPPSAPTMPEVRSTAAEIEQSIGEALQDPHHVMLKPTANEIASAVHRYAAARTPQERAAIDLTGLSGEQYVWLMGLSDADLSRLARVGVDSCAKALDGRRSGVVGLPAIGAPAAGDEITHPEHADERGNAQALLSQRIRASRKSRMGLEQDRRMPV